MNEKLPTAEEFFKRWCNETKRSGGVLIGSSVREFLAAYESHTQAHTEGLREIIKGLIPLAEDGYKMGISNGAHQDFLEDDRALLRKAKEALK